VTVEIEFKDVLEQPDLVFFGLAGSGTVGMWRCAPPEQAAIDELDRIPWGRQPDHMAETVRGVGMMLRRKLEVLEPILRALTETFAGADQIGTPRSLYFRISSPIVEAVPFETLWDHSLGLFAGLDGRWTIARLPADAIVPAGPFTMPKVLHLVAVLAAEGEDAGAQLEALRAAVRAHPELPVEAVVLTSSREMKKALDAEAAPGWTAELIPATAELLMARLRDLRPQLLHLFCHGTAAGPRLLISQQELATLELTAARFTDLAQLGGLAPWLITLNCCEGAAAGEKVGSLAAAMVRAGLPAVLGMRTPVSKDLADEFCADLYREVFARLAEIAPAGPAVRELNWASVISEPRRLLCSRLGAVGDVAGRQREWTMPVLYQATHRLRLRGRPTADLAEPVVDEEVQTLILADRLERNSVDPAVVDKLRRQALDRLYPGA
jgi:hypothetical protein